MTDNPIPYARNIGTDLLRTLAVVVEERSYTKAAIRLGVSQPTISMHVKRLQEQLGFDVFDKTVPGIQLTPQGELTLNYARQILAIHDSLIREADNPDCGKTKIRIGLTSSLALMTTLPVLAKFQEDDPDVTFDLHREVSAILTEMVRSGELDLCAALSDERPEGESVLCWETELVWVASSNFPRPFTSPVDIIGRNSKSVGIGAMFNALRKAGMDYRVVLNASDIDGAVEAARAGLGVTALTKSVDVPALLYIPGEEAGLPSLGHAYWGVYLNAAARSPRLEKLARLVAKALAPPDTEIDVCPSMGEG
jgi:DNA-binding transcriptional LysR family regulator